MKQPMKTEPSKSPIPKTEIVAFGVHEDGKGKYIPVKVTTDGDVVLIEKIGQARPYIQHAYALAGDSLDEYGITRAAEKR